MSEMVDRVMQAALKAAYPRVPFERWTDVTQDDWRHIARAAIKAMREPTAAMVEAGNVVGGFDAYRQEWNTAAIWQSAIDAALKD
jgi:hypothetical protein